MVEERFKLDQNVAKIPWLILGYSRPEGLTRLLSLAIQMEVADIYVSIDGPANPKVDKLQELMRIEIHALVGKSSKSRIHLNQSNTNLGIGIGVVSGIEWFFTQVREGIILEDDLVPNPDFFYFCHLGLEEIRYDRGFWMVCGSQYFGDFSNGSVFGASVPQVWGWATTRDKWSEIRRAIFELPLCLPKVSFKSRFLNFWLVGTRRVLEGKLDTWDIPVVLACILKEKKALFPPVNLITNIGVDVAASNTRQFVFPLGIENNFLPASLNWDGKNNPNLGKLFEEKLISHIYQLQLHHHFSVLISRLLDWYRFPKVKRLRPFLARWLDIPFRH